MCTHGCACGVGVYVFDCVRLCVCIYVVCVGGTCVCPPTTTQRPGSRLQREFSVLILCASSPSTRTCSSAPSLTHTRTLPDCRFTDTWGRAEEMSKLTLRDHSHLTRSNSVSLFRAVRPGYSFVTNPPVVWTNRHPIGS